MKINPFHESVQIKKISETETKGVFDIEGLYTGYGLTIGNALRRILLSSLPGAAITQVKIKNIGHEFTTIPHVLEDVVEISLNLKQIRFRLYSEEPQTLVLKVKGEQKVTAQDIKTTTEAEIANPETPIATITNKAGELEMEITIEKGLGYSPVESRKMEKLPIGVIALDALFSPVTKVNFTVENMRVGDRTDYNRLNLVIETDGTISPSAALKSASDILQQHFTAISTIEVMAAPQIKTNAEKKKKKKDD